MIGISTPTELLALAQRILNGQGDRPVNAGGLPAVCNDKLNIWVMPLRESEKIGLLTLVMIATPAMAAKASGLHIGGDVGQSNWNVTERDANNFTRS